MSTQTEQVMKNAFLTLLLFVIGFSIGVAVGRLPAMQQWLAWLAEI